MRKVLAYIIQSIIALSRIVVVIFLILAHSKKSIAHKAHSEHHHERFNLVTAPTQ